MILICWFCQAEGLVLSGETWDKLLDVEKARVKELEKKFAAKLTEHKVL